MAIKRIAVMGAGTMGNGIAQVAAMSGFDVVMRDVDDQSIARGLELINRSLARFAKSGRLTEQQVQEVRARIKTTTDLAAALDGADYVMEAIPELIDLKRALFKHMDELAPPDLILGTNTSQLSITSIAAATKHPERVIGTHWFNPPVMMRLIEVVKGVETAEQTLETTLDLCQKLGKETVVCRDSQGFITSRAIMAFRLECIRILEEGIATKEDIDKAIKLGFNHPMGPFELSDFNGLDIGYHSALAMTEVFGERFRPPMIYRTMINAGRLGRKTGKGWYEYDQKS